jgi:hypothetical protein
MAVLTTKARKKLAASDFAIPETRSYPIENRAHAANAKARAKQMLKAGKITQAQYNRIVMAANRVLEKG